ncbi:MAG TPA: hypothetical protein VMN38_08125 [Sphingomicrobium sp.]|nr:hypothetical protein [Sphingomicrobium sp.]
MANGMQSGQATKTKPIIVDVYAKLVDGVVEFDHDWKFDGDPTTKKGTIEVPPGSVGSPPARLQFHLHDDTGLKLKFVNPTCDAMWVSTVNKCPDARGDGGQISYDHPWGPKLLQVEDANSGPECILYYTLRFDGDAHTDPDGTQHPTYIYDPTIKNGGGTVPARDSFLTTGTIVAAAAALALIAVLFFWFR